VLLVFVGLAVTAGLAPLVRKVMLHQGVVDVPNHRSSHSVPTPRGGGWACVVGAAAVGLAAQLRGDDIPWLALAAAVVMALVGFLDDRSDLPALARLAGQAVVGAAFGWTVGGFVAAVVGAVVFPAVVNVVNFMDGINGITALTMAVWGVTALVVGRTHDVTGLTILGAVSAGAALGFLPWNAPVARLFLGDVGSYLFGALAAAGILVGWHQEAPVVVLVAPLSIYLADTASTIVARARRREPLLHAHRSHTYQRLVAAPSEWQHITVAAYAAGLAGAATVACALNFALGIAVTIVGMTAYLFTPHVLAHRAGRRLA
jgi:UDP-N-acetylmuramyl pentapeptide phosphotransferase/UDP-N-acetylglucosamine-1-phosphate transferase